MAFYFILFSLLILKTGLVSSKCPDNDEYDFIIAGGGTTGSIIAPRLSENKDVTVLLLEAGGEPAEKSYIPLLAFEVLRTEMDWNYTSVPQKHCCGLFLGKKLPQFRGRALGGTGSVNSMAVTRGNKKDFDLWAEQGNEGWSYRDVLPYFLKFENYEVQPKAADFDKYHRTGGPITVQIPPWKSPMADAFLEAGQELGQRIGDYNAETQTGFMFPPLTLKDGRRCSSYSCFLEPAMRTRSNLRVYTYALVEKVLIDKSTKRATGVQYIKNGETCIARARKEVIISGGAFNSPKMLMLSGIGPKRTLQKHGIHVIVDLPGVGQNLQDHATVGGQMYTMKEKVTVNSVRYRTKKYLDQWYATRDGPMTVPAAYEGIAYYQTKLVKNETDYPDMEIYFNSDTLIPIVKKFINPLFPLFLPKLCKDVISFSPMILRPKSRGYVSIRSKNPHDPPIIDPNYLSHPDDITTLVESVKFVHRVGNTRAFRKYGARLHLGGFLPDCVFFIFLPHEYDRCVVKALLVNHNHSTSSCKMGPRSDRMAVVDSRLRVHGFENLRVADASIMPDITSGHPNAPCMMIGEKVSDMIKEDNHL